MNSNKLLPQFLRALADKIDNNQLTPEQSKMVGEFFMSYLFKEDTELLDDDLTKFLVLGWYIYTHILANVEME